MPNDAPVIIELTSVDVIHELWFPNMRVKQDAVPGMVNRMMFYPKEIGEYDIGCAQHCGVNHYKDERVADQCSLTQGLRDVDQRGEPELGAPLGS